MRILATFAGAFSSGIVLAQYLLPDGWLLPGAAACLLVACLALLLPELWRRRLLLAGTALALALGWNWLYVRQVAAPLEALSGTEASGVTMTLCDYPVSTNYGVKVTVKLEGFSHGKAVYYGDEALLDLVPGQTITDDVAFESAARIRDDDITTFTSKGVFVLAYSRGEPVSGEGTAEDLRWLPARMGQAMREQIAKLFSGDTAAFLTAILTGDKSGLSEKAASDLSEAGVYHILAVSGLHCGMLLSILQELVGRYRQRILAAAAIPALVMYALLTGASPSVVRACIMFSLLLAAPVLKRDGDPPTSLTAALMLILLQNPFAAASISLQLSFGAMAGLLWLTPRLYELLTGRRHRGPVARFLCASVSSTMGALVFTIPLSAYYFGFLVLISPVSNLLCLQVASVVFLCGFLLVLFSFACMPLASLLSFMAGVPIWYLLQVTDLLASLPGHALYFSNPYLKVWLAYAYVLFAAAYLIRPKGRRKYALAAALAVLALIPTVKAGQRQYAGDLNVIMLDVGQGQSIVLSSGGEFALVDCGSANSWYDAGGIAADQLATMGCRELDYLVLTHYDSDHVDGVETLLARMKVDTLLVPDVEDDAGMRENILASAREAGTSVEFVRTETRCALGESRLTIYPPLGDGTDNERGLAMLCSHEDWDLLVTGDMDSATEKLLLETYDLPDLEVLVAGHHGSRGSSSWDFLRAVMPETALISVGSNSYGHPTDEALRRLVLAGAKVYRTDLQGNIYIFVN